LTSKQGSIEGLTTKGGWWKRSQPGPIATGSIEAFRQQYAGFPQHTRSTLSSSKFNQPVPRCYALATTAQFSADYDFREAKMASMGFSTEVKGC